MVGGMLSKGPAASPNNEFNPHDLHGRRTELKFYKLFSDLATRVQ